MIFMSSVEYVDNKTLVQPGDCMGQQDITGLLWGSSP